MFLFLITVILSAESIVCGKMREEVLAAIRGNDTSRLLYLVFQEALFAEDVNDACDDVGTTPLMLALENGFEEMAEMLMRIQANVNAARHNGERPLHVAARKCLKTSVANLREAGADFNAVDSNLNTALHYAAKFNPDTEIASLLLSADVNVNAVNNVGYTALFGAVMHGTTEMVIFLTNMGADVNAADQGGCTPLHFAARTFDKNLVNFLMARGASMYAVNSLCYTPAEWALEFGSEGVITAFLDAGLDVNFPDPEWDTPLHYAARQNEKNIVDMLLKRGARTDVINYWGHSPLMVAVTHASADVVTALCDGGADVKAVDFELHTPLHFAAAFSRNHVNVLLRKGADPNAKNGRGFTPLEQALIPTKGEGDRRHVLTSIVLDLINGGAEFDAKLAKGLFRNMWPTAYKFAYVAKFGSFDEYFLKIVGQSLKSIRTKTEANSSEMSQLISTYGDENVYALYRILRALCTAPKSSLESRKKLIFRGLVRGMLLVKTYGQMLPADLQIDILFQTGYYGWKVDRLSWILTLISYTSHWSKIRALLQTQKGANIIFKFLY